MEVRKQVVVDALRSRGFPQVADEAWRVLPDPVDLDQVAEFAEQQGISRDELISEMGGSPLVSEPRLRYRVKLAGGGRGARLAR